MLLSSGGFEKATVPDIFKAVAFLSVENFIRAEGLIPRRLRRNKGY